MFLDAPVAGIAYTIVGTTEVKYTNAEGEFEYQPGDEVVFSIGGIELPAVTATGVVTPLTVFDTNDLTDTKVVNFARLLQTLDTDGDPDNGISIAEVAHQSAAGLTVDFEDPAFDSNVTLSISSTMAAAPTPRWCPQKRPSSTCRANSSTAALSRWWAAGTFAKAMASDDYIPERWPLHAGGKRRGRSGRGRRRAGR